MSLGETGARSASAISCAFWLTLPPRTLISRIVSLMLFCRPCPRTGSAGWEGAHLPVRAELSLRGRQVSPDRCGAPLTYPCDLLFAKPREGLLLNIGVEEAVVAVVDGIESKSGNFSVAASRESTLASRWALLRPSDGARCSEPLAVECGMVAWQLSG